MTNKNKTKEDLLHDLEQLQVQYYSLLKSKEEQDEIRNVKIKSLFNMFPIAISENDFSKVKNYFDLLKDSGVVDFISYFKNHSTKRDELLKLLQMVKLVDLNQAHYSLYGVTKEEYLSVIPYLLDNYDDNQVEEYINQFIALAEGQLFYVTEMPPHKTINGDLKYVISYLQVAPGFEHDLSIIYVVYIDITERRLAEEALKESEKKLKELNLDKDRFISILAHDLRSPFNSILGFLDLVVSNLRIYDIDTIEEKINIINNSTKGVFNLLEDILMWIRSQSGKLPFEPQFVNFDDLIVEVINEITPLYELKNINIQFLGTNNTIIYADINMMKSILRNLISNAIKFTYNKGQIEVYILDDNEQVFLTVLDNGIGISKDALNNLFDDSKSYSTKGTANEKGSGIGLILCKEFIEKHGGQIWAESKLHSGTMFRFTIPSHLAIKKSGI